MLEIRTPKNEAASTRIIIVAFFAHKHVEMSPHGGAVAHNFDSSNSCYLAFHDKFVLGLVEQSRMKSPMRRCRSLGLLL